MAMDPLFAEMMKFASSDVHRAVSTKGLRKSDWQDELVVFGKKKAEEIQFEASDFDIERKGASEQHMLRPVREAGA
jgi:hypothetical protein